LVNGKYWSEARDQTIKESPILKRFIYDQVSQAIKKAIFHLSSTIYDSLLQFLEIKM